MNNTNLANDLTLANVHTLPTPTRRTNQRAARRAQLQQLRTVLTAVLGCGIPALTLALSRVTGALWAANAKPLLVLGAAGLVLCVLAVSLTHVAHAIHYITRTERWLCWAMALAIDASLVVCEITHVTVGVEPWVCWGVIGGVAVISAALNVYAFKLGQAGRRRKARR